MEFFGKHIERNRRGPLTFHLFLANDLILFAKAFLEQVNVINTCLEIFYASLGRKLASKKQEFFFSRNINHNVAKLLSEELGVKWIVNLGKYLGVPLHHS